MADENWLTTLLKVPARFARKLIDIAYVCTHWSEIEREFKRREDLIKFVEEEKEKRLQYEREAKERMKAENKEMLEKIMGQRDAFEGLAEEAQDIAKEARELGNKIALFFNDKLRQAIITCAYAIIPHNPALRKVILSLPDPVLRERLEKEIQEVEKSLPPRPPESELPRLIGPLPPRPPLPPKAEGDPPPPQKEGGS